MTSKVEVRASERNALKPRNEESRAPPKRRFLRSLRSADWWAWEVLSLVVSGGALVAMVLLLSSLDNKPQPSWAAADNNCMAVPGSSGDVFTCRPVGITVNSVVSWLGTLARLCLLVLLSNGLGQMKWAWLSTKRGKRSLADLETFDAATRGMTGSVQLLWRLKGQVSYLAVLGALGIILSIAFDPFVQNLVSYYTKPVAAGSQVASVSNNTLYAGSAFVDRRMTYASPVTMANVYTALYSVDPSQAWSQPSHVCSTGDCTWPPAASIGMCTSCKDAASLVTKTCSDSLCTLSMPRSDDYRRPEISMNYSYNRETRPGAFGRLDHGQRMGNFFKIASSGGSKAESVRNQVVSIYLDVDAAFSMDLGFWEKEPTYKASHCIISPCIQSFKASYQQSAQAISPYKEELLKAWTCEDLDSGCRVDYNLTAPIEPDYGLYGQSFGIDSITMMGIKNTLWRNLNGYFDKPSSQDASFLRAKDVEADHTVSAIWNGNFTGCAYPDNRVSCALDLVAKALSKTFRDEPYMLNQTRGTTGTAYVSVIHVHVTWYWIALPVLMWILALITFIGAAWKSTAQVHVWRNSTLPMVFMKVENDETEGVDELDLKSLQKKARLLKGSLDTNAGEIAFVRL